VAGPEAGAGTAPHIVGLWGAGKVWEVAQHEMAWDHCEQEEALQR
jgi:hypothetical protein